MYVLEVSKCTANSPTVCSYYSFSTTYICTQRCSNIQELADEEIHLWWHDVSRAGTAFHPQEDQREQDFLFLHALYTHYIISCLIWTYIAQLDRCLFTLSEFPRAKSVFESIAISQWKSLFVYFAAVVLLTYQCDDVSSAYSRTLIY